MVSLEISRPMNGRRMMTSLCTHFLSLNTTLKD
jgi:hypothetical protein